MAIPTAQHGDVDFGLPGTEPLEVAEPVYAGHADVEQHDVEPMPVLVARLLPDVPTRRPPERRCG